MYQFSVVIFFYFVEIEKYAFQIMMIKGYSIWNPEGGTEGKILPTPPHIFLFFSPTPPHIFYFFRRPPLTYFEGTEGTFSPAPSPHIFNFVFPSTTLRILNGIALRAMLTYTCLCAAKWGITAGVTVHHDHVSTHTIGLGVIPLFDTFCRFLGNGKDLDQIAPRQKENVINKDASPSQHWFEAKKLSNNCLFCIHGTKCEALSVDTNPSRGQYNS